VTAQCFLNRGIHLTAAACAHRGAGGYRSLHWPRLLNNEERQTTQDSLQDCNSVHITADHFYQLVRFKYFATKRSPLIRLNTVHNCTRCPQKRKAQGIRIVVRRCNQKFPDWVDNEIYAYNNKHSLRSNTKSYCGKTHYTDSQNSDTTAPSGRELYHLQFLLQAASPETLGYTLVS
jgi:hypothetical protein